MEKSKKVAAQLLSDRRVIGWREWVALPQLGIKKIKAKVDTGACSSSLHAANIERFQRHDVDWVRFDILPVQRSTRHTVRIEMPVLEFRPVRSSTGHVTERPVILVEVELMGQRWPIEMTLASRHKMGFRMLLGREALRGRFLVDADGSFYGGRLSW
ncbi:MAG: ATP-dependent zinc protease [Planctomycetales bacterium]|nr:ATP-dependent zinc protease [Planctomycetales bacterium]MCA9168135.1 ATP-dependent zinc protease [Planctomycetales bacterium]